MCGSQVRLHFAVQGQKQKKKGEVFDKFCCICDMQALLIRPKENLNSEFGGKTINPIDKLPERLLRTRFLPHHPKRYKEVCSR